MSNQIVQAQWSLSTTSDSLLSVARGVMVAATSDNVQPLAILACEQFGSTIAVSSETCAKIETTVLPSPQPAPIGFLKGLVGVFRDDCATQLGSSAAGVRFLALAAALITTLDPFEATKAVDLMLQSSASDLTLLPRVEHIKALLASLEGRAHLAGFADHVVNWHIIIHERLFQPRHLGHNTIAPQTAPSPEMVCRLVDTFRQIARIGDSTITMVTIKAPTSAPWVIAFTEWSLETPPSIYIDNELLGEETGSLVKVIIPTQTQNQDGSLEVIIHYGLENLTELLAPASTKTWSGMTSIELYSKWLFHELFSFEGTDIRVLREAIAHTIPKALSKIKCSEFCTLGHPLGQGIRSIGNNLNSCRVTPLPSINKIADVYSRMFGLPEATQLVFPTNDAPIADLPLVAAHLQSIKDICLCAQCHGYTGSNSLQCKKDRFFKWLAHIVMDIFAFSLFDSPVCGESTLVRLSTSRDMPNSVEGSIFDLVSTETLKLCDSVDIIAWARDMVGHVSNKEDVDIVMTSGRGQVVYPSLFDTLRVEKQGYLRLFSLPGTLRIRGSTYRLVVSPLDDIETKGDGETDRSSYPEVSVPLNLFQNLELVWNLSIQDNDELQVMITARFKDKNILRFQTSPMSMINNLKDTLILEKCSHNCLAGVQDRFCTYSAPWDMHDSSINSSSHVDIIAVDRADDLRALSLAYSKAPSVLRRDACLKCCLKLCRDSNIHIVIL